MADPDALTTYNPGSVSTSVNVGAGGSPLSDLIQRLLMAKLQGPPRGAKGSAMSGPRPPIQRDNSSSRIRAEMARLALKDAQNEAYYKENTPQLERHPWGFTQYHNPLSWNAYQKEIYAPDSASFTTTPEDEGRARVDATEQLESDRSLKDNWTRTGSPGGDSDLLAYVKQLEAALKAKGGK